MKTKILLALTIGLMATLIYQPIASASTDTSVKTNVISVNAENKIYVEPDIAIITIGVESTNKSSTIAQEENKKVAKNVIDEIKKHGIEQKDIKTANYNLYQESNYNKDSGKTTYGNFILNNTMEITIRDINKVGLVVDSALGHGANKIDNINFILSDPDKYYKEALKLAIESGRDKANIIYKTLGVSIKNPSKVEETLTNNVNNYSRNSGIVNSDNLIQLNGGQVEIKAVVNMEYNY